MREVLVLAAKAHRFPFVVAVQVQVALVSLQDWFGDLVRFGKSAFGAPDGEPSEVLFTLADGVRRVVANLQVHDVFVNEMLHPVGIVERTFLGVHHPFDNVAALLAFAVAVPYVLVRVDA